MAHRIEPFVERGELDNRERGRVRGRVWLGGVAEAVVLDLAGDPHPDLAGRRVFFRRRDAAARGGDLASEQIGRVGDITASRRRRVFDLPFEEALARRKQGAKVPERLANVLCVEWYSHANGRVVLEAMDFEITISEPLWEPSADEWVALEQAGAEAFQDYVAGLSEVLDARRREASGKENGRPANEFEAERLLRESDALAHKYGELLDRYGTGDEAWARINAEMGWGEDSHGAESDAFLGNDFAGEVDPPEVIPDPSTEGIDWVRDDDGGISHPLAKRCLESALRFGRAIGRVNRAAGIAPKLRAVLNEHRLAAAKMAGALNALGYGRDADGGALTVASLKRSLDRLHRALAALEQAREAGAVEESVGSEWRTELLALREGALALMEEFRRR